MSIKFWDMKFDGRKYKDKNGFVWELDDTKNNFYAYIAGMGISVLTFYYSLKQLVDMEFEEYVEWSEVPIDTKILVWNKTSKQKYNRHFAGIDAETGKVKAWNTGQTSFTTSITSVWENAELYADTIFALKEGM